MSPDVSREEHEDLKERVRSLETKIDRLTFLAVATLATALIDALHVIRPGLP